LLSSTKAQVIGTEAPCCTYDQHVSAWAGFADNATPDARLTINKRPARTTRMPDRPTFSITVPPGG
jgi:hypothetical protein